MNQRTCSVESCAAASEARGFCKSHYNSWYLHGNPLTSSGSRTFPCKRCGETVTRQAVLGPSPRYCSKRCRNAASYAQQKVTGKRLRKVKPKADLTCAQCLTTFQSSRSNARFCSPPCGRRWQRAHEKGECSQTDCMRPVRAKGLCDKHYKAFLRAEGRIDTHIPWTDARRDAYYRRRAAKAASSTGAPVLLGEIAARDAWTCQLCLRSVDPDIAWPDPLSKSLDHVQPLSLGGAHRPDNVQLAHLGCNASKGNRVS